MWRQLKPLAWALVFVCLPSLAFADYEFYTYNGFQPIVNAFTAIAHIFDSSEIYGLATTAALIGCIAGGGTHIVRSTSGPGINPLFAFGPSLFGLTLFVALFAQDDNLIVYDTVTNEFQTVADVPIGIAVLASSVNKIERGTVDLIETVYPGIDDAAGALDILTAKEFFNPTNLDPYLYQNMNTYVEDCVLFEIKRPGTTLSIETLRSTKDFAPEMAKAGSYSISTVTYSAANPQGVTDTCFAAWESINNFLNTHGSFDDQISAACGRAKFDPTNATQLARCRSLAVSAFSAGGVADVGGATVENLLKQAVLAEAIYNVASSSTGTSMAYFAERDLTTKGFGNLIIANELLPVFKAVMFSIALGIIPLVSVFIASNLAGRALSFIAGIFIFLAAWSVADTVVTASAAPFVNDMMASMKEGQLGLETMLNFPDHATKVASIYGGMRTMAIGIAGTISFMLVKFGGQFMSSVAGQISGQLQTAGAQGGTMSPPDGKTQKMTSMINAAGAAAWMSENNFSTTSGQSQFDKQMGTSRYSTSMQAGANNNITGIKNVADAIAGTGPTGSGIHMALPSGVVSGQMIGAGGQSIYNTTKSRSENKTWFCQSQNGSFSSGSSYGTLSGTSDQSGNPTGINHRDLKNLSASSGTASSSAMIQSGTQSVGSSDNFNEKVSAAVNSQDTNQDVQDFAKTFQTNQRQEFGAQLQQNNSVGTGLKNHINTQLLAGVGLPKIMQQVSGLKLGAQAVSGGEKSNTGSWQLTSGEQEAVQRIYSSSSSKALRQTFTQSSSRTAGQELMNSAGFTEEAKMVTTGQTMQNASTEYRSNMENSFIRSEAIATYGASPTLEQEEQTMERLGTILNSGSAEEKQQLQKRFATHAASYMAANPITASAEQTQTNASTQVGNNRPTEVQKGVIDQAGAAAQGAAANIGQGRTRSGATNSQPHEAENIDFNAEEEAVRNKHEQTRDSAESVTINPAAPAVSVARSAINPGARNAAAGSNQPVVSRGKEMPNIPISPERAGMLQSINETSGISTVTGQPVSETRGGIRDSGGGDSPTPSGGEPQSVMHQSPAADAPTGQESAPPPQASSRSDYGSTGGENPYAKPLDGGATTDSGTGSGLAQLGDWINKRFEGNSKGHNPFK